MIDDGNIWHTATLLVSRHGGDAAATAARLADELFDKGDFDGAAVWRRILSAVKDLTRASPAEGERLN